MVAAVNGKDSDKTLIITLRNRIDKITQKLGAIELKQTDDEIQLFDWTSSSVDKHALLEEEVLSLQKQSQADKSTISALQAQLNDLVKAKAEHEEQLLTKFVLLLDEKKLRIRNLQRMISSANMDKKKLSKLELSMEETSRGPASSRLGKRKARSEVVDEEGDESDDFETMDVDHMPNAVGDARSSRETTPGTETASEDEREPTAVSVSDSPPPKRDLPFTRREAQNDKKGKEKNSVPATSGGEETASDDDDDDEL